MGEKNIDVVVTGHLCIDLLPEMASLPLAALTQAGRLYEVGALDVSTGGAVSNTGLALHRLGTRVKLLSGVGDDMIGGMIVSFLNNRDPELTEYITPVPGVSSSYSIVLSPQRVDRIFLHNPGTNSVFGSDTIDYSVVRGAKIVHLGYPPILPRLYANGGTELTAIFRNLKDCQVITSLDMSLPDVSSAAGAVDWRRILENVLPHVDIFIPSVEEIVFMLRRDEFLAAHGDLSSLISRSYVSSIVDELLSLGVDVAGVKCGVDGIMMKTAHQARMDELRESLSLHSDWNNAEVVCPSYNVHVVGTTGAGDSAYAGFLAAMIRGETLENAARWACAVGACNVEAADATSGVRDWATTARRMTNDWQTNLSRLID